MGKKIKVPEFQSSSVSEFQSSSVSEFQCSSVPEFQRIDQTTTPEQETRNKKPGIRNPDFYDFSKK
ncbi:MAG: hypothetical protein RBT38_14580 [Bacteroidales bacterium]|jgi:hypothetical protein|nr:hypothetical protein [Bacteroidales bacterium]